MIAVARIVLGIAALLYGVYLAVGAFGVDHAIFDIWPEGNASALALIVACVPFGFFVATFTKLGLNHEDHPEHVPESRWRLKRLGSVGPVWRVTWWGGMAAMVAVIAAGMLAPLAGLRFNPIVGLGAVMSLMSGMWLLFVYPTARQLFGGEQRQSAG